MKHFLTGAPIVGTPEQPAKPKSAASGPSREVMGSAAEARAVVRAEEVMVVATALEAQLVARAVVVKAIGFVEVARAEVREMEATARAAMVVVAR